jgi:acetyl esterase/lipase
MRTTHAKHFLSLLCLILLNFGAESQVNGIDQVRYLNPVFEKVEIQKDQVFGEAITFEGKTEKLLLDVYSPAGDVLKKRPAILWIHGGGFRPGNDKSQGYVVQLATEFAKHGYVCLSINYRVRNNPNDDKSGTMTDALTDAMSGLNWLRDNAGKLNVDKNKIFVGGGSAGGRVAVNLCYKDHTEAQKWDKSGIIGLVDLWGSPDESWQMSTVDINDPPTIIIHGTEDKLVSFDISKLLEEELTRNKVKHELIPYVGEGHTPTKDMNKLVGNISRFLYEILTNQVIN